MCSLFHRTGVSCLFSVSLIHTECTSSIVNPRHHFDYWRSITFQLYDLLAERLLVFISTEMASGGIEEPKWPKWWHSSPCGLNYTLHTPPGVYTDVWQSITSALSSLPELVCSCLLFFYGFPPRPFLQWSHCKYLTNLLLSSPPATWYTPFHFLWTKSF